MKMRSLLNLKKINIYPYNNNDNNKYLYNVFKADTDNNAKDVKIKNCWFNKAKTNADYKVFNNKKSFKNKGFIIAAILVLLTAVVGFKGINFAFANNNSHVEFEENISKNISDQLKNLDFSNLDQVFANLSDELKVFGSGNFKDKINQIIAGEYFSNFDNLFAAIINLAFDGFVEFLPLFLIIIAITILSVVLSHFKSGGGSSSGVSDLIHFVSFAVVLIIISTIITETMQTTYTALTSMQLIMENVFPILLTLLTAVGAITSVSIYKPIVAILTGSVTMIFTNLLYPMFIMSFIFILINNLSSTVKLNKFNDFIASSFKWITGFVLTLFSSFLVVQGISAGKFDSVSIKATKFAVKSYVPLIGNFISDGFDFIILSSVLIKNAVGVGVLILIILTILVPIIKLIILKLGLQLLAAFLEPIGNKKISNFVAGTSKILVYPLAIIIGVSFMFLLTVSLMMSTANVF